MKAFGTLPTIAGFPPKKLSLVEYASTLEIFKTPTEYYEATSALDSITEESITETIRNLPNRLERIIILIAHRLSTIMHADRIYVLEKGKISETGSHEELLAAKGLYYAMCRQQVGERRGYLNSNADPIGMYQLGRPSSH